MRYLVDGDVMSVIYRYCGLVQTGPVFKNFTDQLDWLENSVVKKNNNSAIKKLYLFYSQDPRDPIFIRDLGTILDVHPGKNRFLGCSLRSDPPKMPVMVFSENPDFSHCDLFDLTRVDSFEHNRGIKNYNIVPYVNWSGRDDLWDRHWPGVRLVVRSKDNQLTIGPKTADKQLEFRVEDFENFFYCVKYIFDNRQQLIA